MAQEISVPTDIKKQCTRKIRYMRSEDAEAAITRVQAKDNSTGKKDKKAGKLRPYRCPHCSFWHAGHSTSPQRFLKGDINGQNTSTTNARR